MSAKSEYNFRSFDRFGDDLCELLLSYLSISDCFWFECVSKQWKRVVFKRQNRLEFNDQRLKTYRNLTRNVLSLMRRNTVYFINKDLFDYILNKCSFINRISFGERINIDSEVIDIICDNCNHLKELELNGYMDSVSHRMWKMLGNKCGQSLRRISIDFDNYSELNKEWMKTLFRLTPNLIECKGIDLNDCVCYESNGQQFWPKLKILYAFFSKRIARDLNLFAQQFSGSVEEIFLEELNVCTEMENLYFQILKQLSTFEKLKVFDFSIKSSIRYDDIINTGFNLIAMNCKELRCLSLIGFDDSNQILKNISSTFASLKQLLISLKSFNGNFECLKCCPNLTHLTLRAMFYNDDNFNLHLYAPQLRVIQIQCNYEVTDQTLQSFANLIDLYSLRLTANTTLITDKALCHFIIRCENIRIINFMKFKLSVTKVAIDLSKNAILNIYNLQLI
jgi:hypothetical protein